MLQLRFFAPFKLYPFYFLQYIIVFYLFDDMLQYVYKIDNLQPRHIPFPVFGICDKRLLLKSCKFISMCPLITKETYIYCLQEAIEACWEYKAVILFV